MSMSFDDDNPLNIRRPQSLNRQQPQQSEYHYDQHLHHSSTTLADGVTNRHGSSEKYLPLKHLPELESRDYSLDTNLPARYYMAHPIIRFRKMFLLCAAALVLAYASYRFYLSPYWTGERSFLEGILQGPTNSTYGLEKVASFDGKKIVELDSSFMPGGPKDPHGKRRLVFVGDIHGCKIELDKLLAKIKFDEKKDHLIAAGDVISKGEDSPGVLDELIRLKASVVRGNHEDRILLAARTFLDEQDNFRPMIQVDSNSRAEKDLKLLKQLTKQHLRYLRKMPLILQVPPLPLASRGQKHRADDKHHPIHEGLLVAHAGLVPGVALEKQDPYFVMNMRSMNRRTRKPSSAHNKDVPWYDVWNWYQAKIDSRGLPTRSEKTEDFTPVDSSNSSATSVVDSISTSPFGDSTQTSTKPYVVVYGHDSKSGLQIHRWSKGLDTGCVRGGSLTAMVLDASGAVEFKHVNCQNHKS